MTFREALCKMCLHSYNMKVVHWNSTGERFDRLHELADKYYGMLQEAMDTVAEMMGMMDMNPPSFVEMFAELSESEGDLPCIDGSMLFEYTEGVGLISTILEDVVNTLNELHDDPSLEDTEHIGIRSTIETMQYEFSKEKDYFNARRSR